MKVLPPLGLVALVALVAACSDDSVPPPSGGGGSGASAGSGGTGANGGTGGTGVGGSAGSGDSGDVSGAGGIGGVGGIIGDACVNAPDLEVIRTTVPNLRWEAAFCGPPCQGLGHDAFLDCVNGCLETRVPGLSSACTNCYGELAWCAGANCNTWCANQTLNACTPECTADSAQCPGYSTCVTELNQCAGRDSLDCLDDT